MRLSKVQEQSAERRAKILALLVNGGKTVDDLMKDFNESEGKVTSALRTLREWEKIYVGSWDGLKAVFVLGEGKDARRQKFGAIDDPEEDELPLHKPAKITIRQYGESLGELPMDFFRRAA